MHKKLAPAICSPESNPPCSFIEDSYAAAENFAGTMAELEAMGCDSEKVEGAPAGDEGGDSQADCKALVDGIVFEGESLEEFVGQFESILGREPGTPSGDLVAAAEGGCKFTKTFALTSKCEGQFLYLVRNSEKKIQEFCVQDITNSDSIAKLEALPMESVIPIQKSYYAILAVSN